jgi:hypothetical protein
MFTISRNCVCCGTNIIVCHEIKSMVIAVGMYVASQGGRHNYIEAEEYQHWVHTIQGKA